jgi:hypothetical protein
MYKAQQQNSQRKKKRNGGKTETDQLIASKRKAREETGKRCGDVHPEAARG